MRSAWHEKMVALPRKTESPSTMCGIVGAIASRNVVPILTEGLKRLEYRGYDSAGIAVLNGGIRRVRRVGRVTEMENAARAENLKGIIGIAHTRWATHGGVTEPNAHPHVSRNEIAVAHNGTIENHEEQRARLKALAYAFASQTDTEVVAQLIHHYFTDGGDLLALYGTGAREVFARIDSVLILASGTSHYAGMVARYWVESLATVPCSVELGHEYRYRDSIPNPNQLVVTISQSGETLNTMEALKRAKELGHEATLSICNVRESAIPRVSRFVFYTRAGAEIGVASTKAFTTQLVSLFTLALALAKSKDRLAPQAEADAIGQLRFVPGSLQHALNLEPQIREWAALFAEREHALFLGRGIHYPIALEGALKLKEISYIHAEAYPAGELKHGPLALVDAAMPVVVIAPNDALLEKVKSNMQQVRARGGVLYVFADLDSHFLEC